MIPAITGPTGVGKTRVAVALAKKINGEIINADSQSVYRYFKIGTSAPGKEFLRKVKHHFVNFYNPKKQFTVGDFVYLANKKIEEILKKGKIPIVCGGSALYITALGEGISLVPSSKKVRKELEKKQLAELLEELKRVDRKIYEKIDKKNPRRVIRAVEIYRLTGLPPSQAFEKKKIPGRELKIFFLSYPRKVLYEKIDRRVGEMIKKGLVDEVKNILSKGISPEAPAFKSVGYAEIVEFLEGIISFDEAIERIKFRTHNLARKQIIWWRKKKVIEVDCLNKSPCEIAEKIKKILYNKK